MRARFFFLSIVAFWVVMNYLLWRSQWGAHSRIGNEVPPAVVWQKILSAPDNSSLEIYDHDRKIGFCQWIASAGNSPLNSNASVDNDYAPEGMAGPVTDYSLTLGGNTLIASNHIHFEAGLKLSGKRQWRDFRLHLNWRTTAWDFRAAAATQTVTVQDDERTGNWSRTFHFSDLQNPEALLNELGGGEAIGLPPGAGILLHQEGAEQLLSSVHWQAHDDWMQFGHSRVRVYRLETTFLGQHVYFFISRVGEILWVEFPNGVTLRNEAFEHF